MRLYDFENKMLYDPFHFRFVRLDGQCIHLIVGNTEERNCAVDKVVEYNSEKDAENNIKGVALPFCTKYQ